MRFLFQFVGGLLGAACGAVIAFCSVIGLYFLRGEEAGTFFAIILLPTVPFGGLIGVPFGVKFGGKYYDRLLYGPTPD